MLLENVKSARLIWGPGFWDLSKERLKVIHHRQRFAVAMKKAPSAI